MKTSKEFDIDIRFFNLKTFRRLTSDLNPKPETLEIYVKISIRWRFSSQILSKS